jgi:hypothetical protein
MKALPSLTLTGLTAAALAAFAAPAGAQEHDPNAFTLRIGAMNADGDATLRGTATSDALGQSVSGSRDFDFGSAEVSPRIDGVWRISDRNRLIFDYFRYEKDNRQTLGQEFSYGGSTIPADGYVKLDTRFQLASLIYDFSVLQTDNVSLGLEVGAEWAKLDAKLTADAGDDFDGYRRTEKEDGVAPVVGLRFTATPSEHWLINVQGQYLDANWGNFDYDGKIKRANATVEYRFTPNFGLFAGYDWFKINYAENYTTEPGINGRAGLDLEFKGPVAGLTFAF